MQWLEALGELMDFSKRGEVRNDANRLSALAATELVGTPPEERFDRLTRLAAEALGVPATFISFVGKDSDFYKSATGFPEPLATERSLSGETFCHFTLVCDGVLAVEDARSHPLLSQVPTVQSLGVVAYLGVPLRSVDDYPIGAFCAIDMKPRAWSEEDIDSLIAIARVSLGEIRAAHSKRGTSSPEELYDSLAPVVYALFMRILGDSGRASDLLRTFMADIVSRPVLQASFPLNAQTEAAILREARSAALSVRIELGDPVISPQGGEKWPDSLTESERRVLALAYFDGLKIDRIAEIVETEAAEVRTTLIQAMQKVRRANPSPVASFA